MNMSQNSRSPVSDGQGNSGRTSGESRNDERRVMDGFEGMNYEQCRGPYNPRSNGNKDRGENNDPGSQVRRDDL